MAQFVCELCGGNSIVKQGDMFVCQGCGTQYTVEQARQMMNIDAASPVPASNSNEKLENLYNLARRAKEDENDENAAKYYEMIMLEDPSSWEASFYTVYYSAMKCKIAEIYSAATKVEKTIKTVFRLISENVTDEAEQVAAYKEISEKAETIAMMLYLGAKNHYDGISLQIKHNYTQEYINRVVACASLMYTVADELESFFGGKEDVNKLVASALTLGVGYHHSLYFNVADKTSLQNKIKQYEDRIVRIEPNYKRKVEVDANGNIAAPAKSGGCYVATAVYGSYDCPQVWTLRRYRDNTLAKTWYGRAFIHTYYAISPTLVKWFGDTDWFKNMWRGTLDKMVSDLQQQGVEDTPYDDKKW